MKKPKKPPIQRKDPMGYYTDWLERKRRFVANILNDHVINPTTKKEDGSSRL